MSLWLAWMPYLLVGLFLVPRVKPDGTPNSHKILKLKNLSGTYGKATAEIEYDGGYADAELEYPDA